MNRISEFKNLFITAFFSTFLFCSCHKDSPESVALQYCKLKTSLESQKAYDLLSKEDKEYKSLDEFCVSEQKVTPGMKVLLEKLQSSFKFKVLSVEGEDTVNVKIESTTPDIKQVLISLFNVKDALSMIGKSDEDLGEMYAGRLDKYIDEHENIPTEQSVDVIKIIYEDGTPKVFENFALPVRMKEVAVKINDYKQQLLYEEAKICIDSFNTQNQVEYFKQELISLDNLIQNKVSLGKTVKIGSLEITPERVQVSNLNYYKESHHKMKSKVTDEKCFILKFIVKNISKGQVFCPNDFNLGYSSYSTVVDNYQNKMKQYRLGSRAHADKNYALKLQPGQEIEMTDVCYTPMNESAERFMWKLKRRINNQPSDNTDFVYVAFNGSDIKYQ